MWIKLPRRPFAQSDGGDKRDATPMNDGPPTPRAIDASIPLLPTPGDPLRLPMRETMIPRTEDAPLGPVITHMAEHGITLTYRVSKMYAILRHNIDGESDSDDMATTSDSTEPTWTLDGEGVPSERNSDSEELYGYCDGCQTTRRRKLYGAYPVVWRLRALFLVPSRLAGPGPFSRAELFGGLGPPFSYLVVWWARTFFQYLVVWRARTFFSYLVVWRARAPILVLSRLAGLVPGAGPFSRT